MKVNITSKRSRPVFSLHTPMHLITNVIKMSRKSQVLDWPWNWLWENDPLGVVTQCGVVDTAAEIWQLSFKMQPFDNREWGRSCATLVKEPPQKHGYCIRPKTRKQDTQPSQQIFITFEKNMSTGKLAGQFKLLKPICEWVKFESHGLQRRIRGSSLIKVSFHVFPRLF